MAELSWNGWTNKPTWIAALWLNNAGELYDDVQVIVQNADLRLPVGRLVAIVAEDLREMVMQFVYSRLAKDGACNDDRGMLIELLSYSIDAVDWNQIAASLLE